MNIKPAIYRVLTPRQRVISMIDAIGRNDESEIKRLYDSCERKNYRMPDYKYTSIFNGLMNLSMAVESDLRACVIGYLSAADESTEEFYIQKIINTDAAWLALIEYMGINQESMKQIAPPRHDWIDILLEYRFSVNEEVKNKIFKEMKKYIDPDVLD